MANRFTYALLSTLALPALVSAGIYTNLDDVKDNNYDFIVVGGGTAGCLVAARLADDNSTSVLVVEAGYSDEGDGTDVIHVPFLAGGAIGTKFDWNFTTTSQSGMNGRSIPYARGNVLGGSSAINAMIYAKGPSEEYDRLAQVSGDDGWSWDNMQSFIHHNEQHLPQWNHRNETGEYDPNAHGDGQLLTGLTAEPQELDYKVFDAVDVSPDIEYNIDYNSGNGLGWGWIHSSLGNGERSNSAISFLHPAERAQSNIDILLETRATRVMAVDDNKEDFRGIELAKSKNGGNATLTANKELILSAGAVGTPQLLLLSGIGPKDDVSKAGVESIKDIQGVGKGLQDQPILFFQYRVNGETLTSFTTNTTALASAQAQYAQNKTGTLASNVAFNNLAFLRLPDNSSVLSEHGDPSAGKGSPHFVYNFASVFVPNLNQTAPTDGEWFTASIVLQAPSSRGSIKINSTSPWDSPVIDPAFFETDFDIQTMREAVKRLQNFTSSKPFEGYVAEVYDDAKNLDSDDDIEAYIRKFASTNRHTVSTASMDSKDGVVNGDLTVKQTKNLRIVDASVIPYAVGGFPQAEVYFIAERASSLIKQAHSLSATPGLDGTDDGDNGAVGLKGSSSLILYGLVSVFALLARYL